jgi:hypothetical protein
MLMTDSSVSDDVIQPACSHKKIRILPAPVMFASPAARVWGNTLKVPALDQ